MREKLVETRNVIIADNVMGNIDRKDSTGLVLIYGEPGTGKTYYTHKRTFSNGWIYSRMTATETAKSFLQQLYRRLNRVYTGSNEIIKGNSAKLETECIDMIKQLPDQVIVIDEVNLAAQFRKWEIIEVLRDFKDIADATIVMVGEHDTMDALKAYNPHFFNRCEFVNFIRNTAADVAKIIKTRAEVEFSKDLYDEIILQTKGDLRKVEKLVKEIEIKAFDLGLNSIGKKALVEC